MNVQGYRSTFLEALSTATKKDSITLGGNQGIAIAKNQPGTKWKPGSEQAKSGFRAFTQELFKEGHITESKMKEMLRGLQQKPLTIDTLQKAMANLGAQPSSGNIFKKMKTAINKAKVEIRQLAQRLGDKSANAEIRDNEIQDMRAQIKRNAQVQPQQEVPVPHHEEIAPQGDDTFIRQLKKKQAEMRPGIENRYSPISGEPKSRGNSISGKTLSEKQINDIVSVLKRVLSGGAENEGKESPSVGHVPKKPLSEKEVNDLVNVLKNVAPEGIGHEHEGVESEGEEAPSVQHPPQGTVSEKQISDLVEVLKQLAPQGLEHEGQEEESIESQPPQQGDLDHIDLHGPSSETSTQRTGPTRGEIDKLADILIGKSKPTQNEIDKLIETLTGGDKN